MTAEKLIGLVLIVVGAALASLSSAQFLFPHDSANLPMHIALPWAAAAILTGAVAFKISPRVAAPSRWSRLMPR